MFALWEKASPAQKDRVIGLCFIFAVALIWVLASFLVQDLEGEGLNAFLLTYIANSLFVVYLPVYYICRQPLQSEGPAKRESQAETAAEGEPEGDSERLELVPPSAVTPGIRVPQPQLVNRKILKAAAVVAPLWFAAQLTFNYSLSITNVTSNTILSSTSSLFTYGLSCLVLHEAIATRKLVAIALVMAGTALVTVADGRNASTGHNSVLGDVLVLVSGMCYAAYTVAIRKMLHEESGSSTMLFFGYIGLLNAMVLAPLLAILMLVSVISVAKLSVRIVLLAIAKGLFDNVLSDYLWARAVLYIGPTVATVGLSMQVPLAVVLDIIFKRPPWMQHAGSATLMALGATSVLAGFFGINVGAASEPTLTG